MTNVSRGINLIWTRSISTTSTLQGKRNFKKFLLYNKRGTAIFKKQQAISPDPDIPINKRGVRDVGYEADGRFVTIPEMIPQLIVPVLSNFKLKPYVSYKTPDVVQSKFTSKDLFDAIYSKKIVDDFKSGRLDSEGNSVEPSSEESLTPDEARTNALKTGSDIF